MGGAAKPEMHWLTFDLSRAITPFKGARDRVRRAAGSNAKGGNGCYGATVEYETVFAAQATNAAAPVSGIFSFVPDSDINAAAFNPS